MQKLIAFLNKLILIFNKRTIRTIAQLVLGFAIGAPIVLGLLPADQATSTQVVEILAVCAGITRVWNLLEDRGLIPAWLKDSKVHVELKIDDTVASGMAKASASSSALSAELDSGDNGDAGAPAKPGPA